MYKRSSDNRYHFEVENVPDAAKVADIVASTGYSDKICLQKVRLESKMQLRLKIFEIKLLSIYSVLDGLRDRRLEVIQDEMLKIVS